MTSFYADSFSFFSNKPTSICAFLATSRLIFHSSIIPVTLNKTDLWKKHLSDKVSIFSVVSPQLKVLIQHSILKVFFLSDTAQFSPSLFILCKNFQTKEEDAEFQTGLLHSLINSKRYFSRSLKHFGTRCPSAFLLICQKVPLLVSLDLSYSDVSDNDLKSISSLTQIRDLNLESCRKLTDSGLVALAQLTTIEKLDLNRISSLHGSGFKFLSKLTALNFLDLSYMDFLNDEGMKTLPSFPALQILNFSGILCALTSAKLAAITRQRNLKCLTLEGRSYYQSTPHILNALLLCGEDNDALVHLEELHLDACGNVDDQFLIGFASGDASLKKFTMASKDVTEFGFVKFVTAMSDLEELNISYCTELDSDDCFQAISNLKQLRTLGLQGINFSEKAIEYICRSSTHLQSLSLGYNARITDRNLESLSKMESLRVLGVRSLDRNFTARGIRALAQSLSLEDLSLEQLGCISDQDLVPFVTSKSLRKLLVEKCQYLTTRCIEYFTGSKVNFDYV